MAVAQTTMTDEQRKSVALEYLKAFDNGGVTSTGDSILSLFASDAQVADRVTFMVGDLFTADLSEATVVTMYLSPNILKQIEPGLRALKPGTRIVSHQFPMSGWTPDKRMVIDEAELLLWIVR